MLVMTMEAQKKDVCKEMPITLLLHTEIGFPGWNWRHEVKNRPWGAVKAEGMGAFFNTLLLLLTGIGALHSININA